MYIENKEVFFKKIFEMADKLVKWLSEFDFLGKLN